MPKEQNEEQWQYMGRMVRLAEKILTYIKTNSKGSGSIWTFPEVAAALGVPEEDASAACNTSYFTHDCHVRDGFFFQKTRAERLSDLDWMVGTGRFAQ